MLTPLEARHLEGPFLLGLELLQTNIPLETYPYLWQPPLSLTAVSRCGGFR